MRIYHDRGKIVHVYRNDAELATYTPSVSAFIEIDPTTNAALCAELSRSTDRFSFRNGELARDGVTVQIASDSALQSGLKKLRGPGGLSSAEIEAVLNALLERSV